MEKNAKNYDLKDDEILCPVCGTLVKLFDVCPVCNWENTGEVNIDGGPNKMSLKAAIEAFAMVVQSSSRIKNTLNEY